VKIALILIVLFGFSPYWGQNHIDPRAIEVGDSIVKASYGECMFNELIHLDPEQSNQDENGTFLYYNLVDSLSYDLNSYPIFFNLDSLLITDKNGSSTSYGLLEQMLKTCSFYSLDSATTRTPVPRKKNSYAAYFWDNSMTDSIFGVPTISISFLKRKNILFKPKVYTTFTYDARSGAFIKTYDSKTKWKWRRKSPRNVTF